MFPKWYTFTTRPKYSYIINEETFQSFWIFTSDNYTRSDIKERVLEFEKQHKAKYQTLIEAKYKLPTFDVVPKTHYILEVNTK